eukprot:TRINITY_DN10416_c0_g1_i1.p1 TRINITY_DN10416_c0_g1~~TRINITY_DN10416_c0_g1_i1.p1  ORF type:complete len:289 (-),score=55.96 TRINITY_DN10416_c0_g1_i1:243-1109(-)
MTWKPWQWSAGSWSEAEDARQPAKEEEGRQGEQEDGPKRRQAGLARGVHRELWEAEAWHQADALDDYLSSLADGSTVAVIGMRGSLCPITLGHVRCYIEARKVLLADPSAAAERPARLPVYSGCIGLVTLNSDKHIGHKLWHKGQQPIVLKDRRHLINLAAAELDWLSFDYWGGAKALAWFYPKLTFVDFDMNGADDVVKYEKWDWCNESYRMVVLGRPGHTEAVLRGMQKARLNKDDGYLIMGPELPDISSTAAREAAQRGDRETLLTMLHRDVADWLLQREDIDSI